MRIPGFPPGLDVIPEDAYEYLLWREDALAYRTMVHRLCAETEPDYLEQRAWQARLCQSSVAYFIAVFGVIHEPRVVIDKRIEDGEIVSFERTPGWYPWIPYGYQVETWEFIDRVLGFRNDLKGRGDGVAEKARDMGITWCFCAHAAHGWLFADDFVVGFVSHKQENVDSLKPKSMFYKVEALIGINTRIGDLCISPGTIYDGIPLRIPDWLLPSGFDSKEHDRLLNLIHPEKSNQIVGEATTGRTATGDRWLYGCIDEASKIKMLEEMYDGMAAVTDHRFVFSSPERQYGDMMYNLATSARQALQDPSLEGPSLLSLRWDRLPLRDDSWYAGMKARFKDRPHIFEREYELNWNAGMGGLVYPFAQDIYPGEHPYDPTLGQVWCSIDPGLRDPTAVTWFQHVPQTGEYNVIEAWTGQVPSAEYLAPILMGFPPHHPELEPYASDAAIVNLIETTWQLRSTTSFPVNYVGDTWGDSVGGGERSTFYTGLRDKARELNALYPDLKPVEIRVQTKYDEGARFHRARKEATAWLLTRLRFHNTPRVRYLISALQSYRYKDQTGTISVSEPTTPQHDWSSHPATSVEFFAVRARLGARIAAMPKLSPQRFRLSAATRRTG